jgi:DNA-binding NtrC family response regulator
MPDGNGLSVMREVRSIEPRTGVILLTAYGSVPDAVNAMRDGACDYLVKPVSFEQLERSARRILDQVSPPDRHENPFIGDSAALQRALERARQAAASDADILIEAESGTGKELLARFIHRLSRRSTQPFVAVNCTAFPETLLDSELFGHTRGAFTGALAAKPGKFELADHGTLLLDEVGEMPLSLQPKLLRVLQEREFDRLGDTRTQHVDIRVIATTNKSLRTAVKEGKFRDDLYYRLNVIPLSLPPLRDRLEDVPELVRYFAHRSRGDPERFSADFIVGLQQYAWPGNVRELENVIRRAVAMGDKLEPTSEMTSNGNLAGDMMLSAGLTLRELEKQLIERTLAQTGGNRSRAAEMLGISLRTVRNKIRDYGLPARSAYAND